MKLCKYTSFITEGSNIRWTKEKCQEEALKYSTRNEFFKKCANAYNACIRNKWIEEVCSHMISPNKPNNYWTKERCAEEALKYKSRSEFEKNSPFAYAKSGAKEWKDEICSHMNTSGNKYNRCIYAVEFPDNNVYIGLTYDFNKRFHQHLNDVKTNSSVFRHYTKTKLVPVMKQLTDYIAVDDASKVENIKKEEYIKNGWVVLNKAKCGNVGGKTVKWIKERCQVEALKYDTRNEFKIKSPNAYHAALRNKWIDEICSHMSYKNNPSGYWTKEVCQKEASRYRNREDFKKSGGAFGSSYRNGWLDEFFPKN